MGLIREVRVFEFKVWFRDCRNNVVDTDGYTAYIVSCGDREVDKKEALAEAEEWGDSNLAERGADYCEVALKDAG